MDVSRAPGGMIMENPNELREREVIDLLNRCWMTHDGMWFLQTYEALGIEKANQLNQAAIRALAPLEIARIRRFLGREGPIGTAADLREFFQAASRLFIPDFMGATMSFPGGNTLHWEFKPMNCFAYKGMKRIGAIEGYECGVIYRVECWLEALGLAIKTSARPKRCLMHLKGECSGDIELVLP